MEFLKWLIENNQKTVSVFLAVGMAITLLAWPTVAGVLYLERIGYFDNVYQEEHKQIILRSDHEARSLNIIAEKLEDVNAGILLNRDIFQQWLSENAWQSKRTCINTAKTEELRDECTKPSWMRGETKVRDK